MDRGPEEFFHDDGAGPYAHCPRCGGALEKRVVFTHDPERPYPPFEQQLSRACADVARICVARATAIETLRCEAGDHDWERPKRPGAKPRSCPEHRSKRVRADVIHLAPRTGVVGASDSRLGAVRSLNV